MLLAWTVSSVRRKSNECMEERQLQFEALRLLRFTPILVLRKFACTALSRSGSVSLQSALTLRVRSTGCFHGMVFFQCPLAFEARVDVFVRVLSGQTCAMRHASVQSRGFGLEVDSAALWLLWQAGAAQLEAQSMGRKAICKFNG